MQHKLPPIVRPNWLFLIEQKTKALVTDETFLIEEPKLREEMASMKAELIKWNAETIIVIAGVVAAIVKLIG